LIEGDGGKRKEEGKGRTEGRIKRTKNNIKNSLITIGTAPRSPLFSSA